MSDAQRYRRLIAQAWGGMLALLLTMLMVDTLQHAMAGQYAELSAVLAHDPGRVGLAVLVGLICCNTLVQLLVQGAEQPRARAAVFAASVLYTLFFVAHQVVHLVQGESLGLHTALDLTHHALGAVACWASWRWWRVA